MLIDKGLQQIFLYNVRENRRCNKIHDIQKVNALFIVI